MTASAQPTPAQPWAATGHPNPMATHVRIVGIIELVWGTFAGLAALTVLVMFLIATVATSGAGAPGFVPGIIVSFGLLIVAFLAGLAALAVIGGLRLLKHRRSGRTLSYVCAALSLFSFPLGTAFGIYAFIILSKAETEQLLVNP